MTSIVYTQSVLCLAKYLTQQNQTWKLKCTKYEEKIIIGDSARNQDPVIWEKNTFTTAGMRISQHIWNWTLPAREK